MTKRYFEHFAPRWIIFCCDVVLISTAFALSFFLIHHLSVDLPDVLNFVPAFIVNLLVGAGCVALLGTYKGIIRYSEIKDILRIIKFAALQFSCWLVIYFVSGSSILNGATLPLLVINFFAVSFLMVVLRLLVKEVYFRAQSKPNTAHRTLIFGAGMMGRIAKKVLEQDVNMSSTIIGFIDDSDSKIGKKIEGLPIYSAEGNQLVKLIQEKGINQLYIAVDKLSVDRKIAITDLCAPFKIKINVVPHANEWSRGLFQKNQVKEMNIEELLQRDEIFLPNDLTNANYTDSVILVTGAAGSIGSEICRQLLKHKVQKLILLDQSESGLFDLEYELKQKGIPGRLLQVEVASARDFHRIKKVFSTHNPDVVFHVAAYKHVPLMEFFSSEAVLTNVFGTKVVADLSLLHSVKKFVLVSTDKAVNPTNVMGATKRISEIYIQSLNDRFESTTHFITTRFGNVLGSAGSVVATFKKQIAAGGPITITHPDITRYFMTIPEAAKLVLEAGKIGKSGDILLFDMGQPVKVVDLARRMIQLAGLLPDKDITIKFTQLRPGEKMFEELFKDSEEFATTDHPKILRATKATDTNPDFYVLLNELQEVAEVHNNEAIPKIIVKMLPEFVHSPNKLFKKVLKVE